MTANKELNRSMAGNPRGGNVMNKGLIGVFYLVILCTIFLNSTAYAQKPDLPVIGVTEIKAPADDPHIFSRVDTKAGNFQVMLETHLTQIGRFKIIERARVDEILQEQGINNTFGDGRTAGGGFNVEGVDYLVYGSITKFGQRQEEVSTGSFSSSKTITEFAADIKVVDASTGEVRIAEIADVRIETASGISTGKFQNSSGAGDPLAESQRIAAKKVAAIIATGIFPIEVVKAGETIYVNYGEAILDVGDVLKAFRKGEELIDEATGINLGAEEEEIGTIEIFEVTDKFSKGRLLSGNQVSSGDLLRIIQKADEVVNQAKPGAKRGREI